jgi:asparagine synthase (glutamine-hydrolysing)
VVDFCCRLPARMKLRVLRDKHLLREAARGLVPGRVSGRPKRPYRAPIQKSFLNSACRPWVREALGATAVRESGLFQADAVAQLVDKAERGGALGETDNMALVGILSAQVLHRRFCREFSVESALGAGDDVKVIDRRGKLGDRRSEFGDRSSRTVTS